MVYLMRHGQDDESYVGGWSSVPLIPEGVEMVKERTVWIAQNLNVKRIIASDIERVKMTTEIVNASLNVPVSFTASLREQNKGIFNGKLKSTLTEEELNFMKNASVDTVYPNGESLLDLYKRVKLYFEKLKRMDDSVLLITHRGFINSIYCLLKGEDITMDKEKYGVSVASVHALEPEKLLIRKMV